ncbi:hypothetical protein [Fibrobacter sp. HC4]|uniref:hypothetical protein n=1 Tax=Fibrobacter sp. HC4 TaxID=3239812 RepID=UPI0020192472|nr:hypothetical protein [Fibrobacter succinogenes]MCL4101881.1 hypothetical protein [Fibrobacter succinogenes]
MKFEKDTLYVWVGGSCDYGHKERAGGGAYIAETFATDSKDGVGGKIVDTYTTSDFNTKEFQMIYRAMDHVLEKFGTSECHASSENRAGTFEKIVFLSNVQYIQNYPKPENVEIRILPYHKFPRQKEVHDMASQAMRDLRSSGEGVNT